MKALSQSPFTTSGVWAITVWAQRCISSTGALHFAAIKPAQLRIVVIRNNKLKLGFTFKQHKCPFSSESWCSV